MANIYRIVYNPCCFYWAVLNEQGREVFAATTKNWAERWCFEHQEEVKANG